MPLIDDVRVFTGLRQEISSLSSRLEEVSHRISVSTGVPINLVSQIASAFASIPIQQETEIAVSESLTGVPTEDAPNPTPVSPEPTPVQDPLALGPLDSASVPWAHPAQSRLIGPVELARIIRERVFRGPNPNQCLTLESIVLRLHAEGISRFPSRCSSFVEYVRYVACRQTYGFDKPFGQGSDAYRLVRPHNPELQNAILAVVSANPGRHLSPGQFAILLVRYDTDEVRRTLRRMANSRLIRVYTTGRKGSRRFYGSRSAPVGQASR
jgi:hypothetical protein